ncbi:MAG: hypothetical protein K0V04_11695 [Deltaproteobacteria bacterium]|nr:hypothetical protein [Deltaproteobacteria bacterium]
MKTALTILGGIFATLVAAVAIFYWGWLRPPPADAVCDNVARITGHERASTPQPPAPRQAHDSHAECVARASRAPEFGRAVWVRQLECMRDAADMAGLARCKQIRSI